MHRWLRLSNLPGLLDQCCGTLSYAGPAGAVVISSRTFTGPVQAVAVVISIYHIVYTVYAISVLPKLVTSLKAAPSPPDRPKPFHLNIPYSENVKVTPQILAKWLCHREGVLFLFISAFPRRQLCTHSLLGWINRVCF